MLVCEPQVVQDGHQSNVPRAEDAVLSVSTLILVEPLIANPHPAVNWTDAKRRVLKSYREWMRAVSCPFTCLPGC